MCALWKALQTTLQPSCAPAARVWQGASVPVQPLPLQGQAQEHTQESHHSQTHAIWLYFHRLVETVATMSFYI